jgi:hypothetical protein
VGHYSKALLLGSNNPKGLYVYLSFPLFCFLFFVLFFLFFVFLLIKNIHDPLRYYSNRAQAYLKLRRWSEAITDCTLSICCFPTAKAYLYIVGDGQWEEGSERERGRRGDLFSKTHCLAFPANFSEIYQVHAQGYGAGEFKYELAGRAGLPQRTAYRPHQPRVHPRVRKIIKKSRRGAHKGPHGEWWLAY